MFCMHRCLCYVLVYAFAKTGPPIAKRRACPTCEEGPTFREHALLLDMAFRAPKLPRSCSVSGVSAHIHPILAGVGQVWPNVCQLWPTSERQMPSLANRRPKSDTSSPTLVVVGRSLPNLATCYLSVPACLRSLSFIFSRGAGRHVGS